MNNHSEIANPLAKSSGSTSKSTLKLLPAQWPAAAPTVSHLYDAKRLPVLLFIPGDSSRVRSLHGIQSASVRLCSFLRSKPLHPCTVSRWPSLSSGCSVIVSLSLRVHRKWNVWSHVINIHHISHRAAMRMMMYVKHSPHCQPNIDHSCHTHISSH